jgi:sucrose-6-phosphate hydrolase SacC (GH32 family)
MNAEKTKGHIPFPAPLFRDPIYDSPTDPVVIWNRQERCWWMMYTQRRATDMSIGFSSIHGTKIGVASSKDGGKWLYRGTLPGLDTQPGHNTFWAPEVIFANGKYHMYVSYITGVPTDWNYPRHILHYSADDMWSWKYESTLALSSNRVIDACVYETSPGTYKMWYKDEDNHSYSYAAKSYDLYNWEIIGPEVCDVDHEGPNVFEFGGKKWMITDCWDGLAIYETQDFTHWTRQEGNILRKPGIRPWDDSKGNHADVVVNGGHAFIFYFSRPYVERPKKMDDDFDTYIYGRNAIQVAQLEVIDGKLVCDRDRQVTERLIPPEKV